MNLEFFKKGETLLDILKNSSEFSNVYTLKQFLDILKLDLPSQPEDFS